jgi:hypothetical protein
MKLKLKREASSAVSTIGRLEVDGNFECYTVEDVEREGQPKVHGQTAIRRGTYRVIVTMSSRFHRALPLLVDVPDFAGVRIHPGNTAADTEGCILPGRRIAGDGVSESRLAFEALFAKIRTAIAAGEDVTIEITGV